MAAAAPEATLAAGPWRTAASRLRRDRIALAAGCLLALIVLACVLAPVYANHVAHTDPFSANPSATTVVDGREVPVMQPAKVGLGVYPIGPTWDPGHYLLGADENGRDVAARLLYAGRNTLLISVAAASLASVVALMIGLVTGFFGGLIDTLLTRLLDVVWAFPVLLLAISLSAVLFNSKLDLGVITIESGSLLLPIVIIGAVYVPYIARPIRGEVLSLRQKEFVEAGIAQGAGDLRLIVRDILPNVITTMVVFLPLMVATAMLLESALSYLGIGVRAPDASWGTIIQDGTGLLRNRPLIAIVPGVLIALSVMSLNVLGDGVRDALDPRARLRIRDASEAAR